MLIPYWGEMQIILRAFYVFSISKCKHSEINCLIYKVNIILKIFINVDKWFSSLIVIWIETFQSISVIKLIIFIYPMNTFLRIWKSLIPASVVGDFGAKIKKANFRHFSSILSFNYTKYSERITIYLGLLHSITINYQIIAFIISRCDSIFLSVPLTTGTPMRIT